MTDRLDDKIQSLMVQVVEASPPAHEIEEIMELRLSTEPALPVITLRPRLEFRPRRGWLVALGAAAAVLVVVGGVAWLLRSTGSDTPVATTPQIESFSALTWSRVPDDEAAFGGDYEQAMSSVTVGGPGLVAVGGADSSAAVWTSPDGITWSRVPDDEAVFGGDAEQWMTSVTVGGPGLVAVGSDGSDAAVWISIDGIAWLRVPHDDVVFGGPNSQGMASVIAGGPGLVAVGWDSVSIGNGNAAVWTSPDGITWSRVPDDEAVFGGARAQWMSGVTVGGPGLVAVGSAGIITDLDAAVWTSVDGLTWSRVPRDETVFGGERGQWMLSVTAGGPGLVAVGEDLSGDGDGDGDVAVWTSVDGVTWSRVAHDEAVLGGAEMGSVTVAGPGLVAVGWDSMGAVVWTSPDGIAWSRVPHDEAVFGARPDRPVLEMSSITVGGPGLVVVGSSNAGEQRGAEPPAADAAIWVAVPGE